MKLLSIPILFYFLAFIAINVHSQNRFFVKGEIDSIKDGETLKLYRYRDGSIDAASVDTIYQGKFLLSDTVSHPTLYWILSSGNNSPNLPLEIWGAPGITINVRGQGYYLKTWNAKSSLHEQWEENQYLAPSITDWNKVQEIEIQQQKISREMQKAIGNEKHSQESRRALLSHQRDSILANIDRTQIGLLQKLPVTEIWLNKMWELSFHLTYAQNLPYRESILQLYKRITDKQRTSPIGEKIIANLFPPTIEKIGDTMADMPLLDTQMAIHTMAEYKDKGKYLLLDFGFINCGACLEAIPETKVLYDSLIDKLIIIGVNVDETAYWKAKSKGNQISWVNLNDSKGRSGLALRYGVKAYPYYVIISPDGIVLDTWIGSGKGELTRKIMTYIKSH